MFKYSIYIIIVIALFSSCDNFYGEDLYHFAYDDSDSCLNKTFVYDNISIVELGLHERPYVNSMTSLVLPKLKDDNNILLHEYLGNPDYHPVAMATYATSILDVYRRTGDSTCLSLSIAHANKLIGISLMVDTTILFPYSFDYPWNDRDQMVAPWYSAMAQGKALSLFSRLFEITSDKRYLNITHKIFKSFGRLKGAYEPWISCIDKNNNLWFEEYPYERSIHVLNGMNFAIYGIYDYYLITKTKESLIFLKAALTTIKRNMHLYRDVNKVSYYSLKYDVKVPQYHQVHIDQFRMFYNMTGILDFRDMSETLEGDTLLVQ